MSIAYGSCSIPQRLFEGEEGHGHGLKLAETVLGDDLSGTGWGRKIINYVAL